MNQDAMNELCYERDSLKAEVKELKIKADAEHTANIIDKLNEEFDVLNTAHIELKRINAENDKDRMDYYDWKMIVQDLGWNTETMTLDVDPMDTDAISVVQWIGSQIKISRDGLKMKALKMLGNFETWDFDEFLGEVEWIKDEKWTGSSNDWTYEEKAKELWDDLDKLPKNNGWFKEGENDDIAYIHKDMNWYDIASFHGLIE